MNPEYRNGKIIYHLTTFSNLQIFGRDVDKKLDSNGGNLAESLIRAEK